MPILVKEKWCVRRIFKRKLVSKILLRELSHTSGEKLPPYLRLSEKAIAYSVAIKVGK